MSNVVETGILQGRPFGGLITLINKMRSYRRETALQDAL